ncbi:TBC1 domain family member 4-like [Panonychus citri]|uniref:TBC1 domain family member 4-like n=1 Tax=Panonychus citri TaxID=50023 RepID=UPI002306E5EF|nr:TBC1 domain family member 4-like [Panonychus citri]
MEKENKRLQANQNVVTCKRMKLDYEEITPCLKETTKMWDELLKRDPNDSSLEYLLKNSIKKGVPRSKRGEIWQFIARYNKQNNRMLNGGKDVGTIDPDQPYRQLLQQLTAQQHAILVDLGRTFPKHPYFSQALGAGQLSLFNLLKAYSLFDIEVGYCQGLSFVAAILLLHMNEDESFEMMKYLLFHLGLRRQYKPDMSALQMQLYQLTRLLYDFHHDIYQHFDTHDIPPTLYAAPWFLTLFASQFPIGFVARLFDIIFLFGIEAIFRLSIVLLATYREAILSCTSFETIMELLKSEIPQMDAIQMERVFNQVLSRDISRQLIVYETEYNLLQEEVSSLSTSFGSNFGANNELFGSNGNITNNQSNHHHHHNHHQISLPPTLSPVKGQQLKSTISFSTVSTQYADDGQIKQLINNNFVDCSTSTVNSPIKESPLDVIDSGHHEDTGRSAELEGENKLLKSQNMELLDQLHVAQSNVYSLESSIETLKSTIKRLESRVRSVEEERDALFDSLNMLRQRTTTSATQSGSSSIPTSAGGTPLPSSPLPESLLE